MTPESFRPTIDRFEATSAAAGRRIDDVMGRFPTTVGRVFGNPTVPSQGGRYFSVRPVAIAGVEAEGAPGVLTADASRSFLVFVTGANVPVAGDDLICRFVGNRWAASAPAAVLDENRVVVPGCPCPDSPRVLRMSSSKPLSNDRIFQNATFEYRPVPAAVAALSLPELGYFSTSSFLNVSTGDYFWYYLYCNQGFYRLTRLFETSVYGSPYRDVVRYSWLVGVTGNSCQPYLLSQGQIFSGGDSSCVVVISE